MNHSGSVLLMVLLLCSFLSICLLFATNSVLLGNRAQNALQSSMELFYIAEAGVAHGRAFCTALALDEIPGREGNETGSSIPDSPFDVWTDWGGGSYRVNAFVPAEPQSVSVPVPGAPGLLLSVTATLGSNREKRLLVLVETPPSCETVAWWEP